MNEANWYLKFVITILHYHTVHFQHGCFHHEFPTIRRDILQTINQVSHHQTRMTVLLTWKLVSQTVLLWFLLLLLLVLLWNYLQQHVYNIHVYRIIFITILCNHNHISIQFTIYRTHRHSINNIHEYHYYYYFCRYLQSTYLIAITKTFVYISEQWHFDACICLVSTPPICLFYSVWCY